MNQSAQKRRLLFGSLFFALMFFYAGAISYFQLTEIGSYSGWGGYSNDGHHFFINRVDPVGPTAALRPGDEILAINGISPAQDFSILDWFDRVRPDMPFSMTVRRDGQVLTIQNKTAPYPSGQHPLHTLKRRLLILNIWLFLIVGLAVLALKPDSRQAWLLALLLGTFTGTMTDSYPFSALGIYVEILVSLAKISALWFFAIFPLFFLNFPARSPLLQRLPRLEGWLYWSIYFLLLPYWIANRLPSVWRSQYANMPVIRTLLDLGTKFSLPVVIITLYLLLGFFFMVVSYRTAQAAERKRLRVAMIGSSAGFFMLFLLVLNNFASFSLIPGWQTLISWVANFVLWVALPLIPLSFAYAIVRHKVIPISLIIRRGVRYLLVSRGSIALEFALLGLLFQGLLESVLAWFRPASLKVVGTVSAIVAVVIWQSFRWLHKRYLAPVIDRSFFRESYDAQQILTALAQSVRSATNARELLQLVVERIQQALHSTSVTIFLRDTASGDMRSEVAAGYNSNGRQIESEGNHLLLPASATVLRHLDETHQPLVFNGDRHLLEDSAAPFWHDLRPDLLLPLTGKNGLLGVISLGERAGDLPYSKDDERMLMNVAVQTALAIENTRLFEHTLEQERQRQELAAENEQRARELEEARQLQLSMLPRHLPQLPHVEIAAYMKTASEVGGDYYDFHQSEDGTLTAVVGDATGHGLKAGTLVSSVKSLFISLAEQPEIPFIMHKMSQVIRAMKLRGLFMALTIIKLRDDQLSIGAAGMPYVLIVRSSGEIDEVQINSPPLGGLANYQYCLEQHTVRPGDVIVLLSDGLAERFNPQNEMFEAQRIRDVLNKAAQLHPQEIINQMVRAGDAWAAGRPQDDDVTFVVLRIR